MELRDVSVQGPVRCQEVRYIKVLLYARRNLFRYCLPHVRIPKLL